MKIFEVVPQLSTGGAERFVVDLCNELSIHCDVVLVVLWPIKGDQAFFFEQISKNVIVECVEKKPGFDFKVFYKLHKLIKKYRPDVIHSHIDAILYTGFFQVFFAKGVHTVHSLARHEAVNSLHRTIRFVLFKLNFVHPVTISKEAQGDFEAFYHTKSKLIYNGRDVPQDIIVSENVVKEIDKFKRDKNTQVIVQLAHVDRVKRQLLMANVAKKLVDDGFNFCILFVGSYTRVPSYTEEVRSMMPDNCHFLGEKHNPLEYLKYSGAFGLCSSVEGFPISLIEALGVGAIPICTPVGGIKDVINDGENGYLSEDISEESYYRALKRFLSMTEEENHKMSKAANESYLSYSMKECARHYFDYFKTI